MLKELLMLKHLNINGALINFIVENFSSEDMASLFNGKAFDLQFKYNIFEDEHLAIFYDENKLKITRQYVDILIEKSLEQNIKILSYYDDEYPANLKAIKKPPLFLYVKGNVDVLRKSKSIACVGARTPSKGSVELVERIVEDMVKEGIIIISGLAKGIDAYSHRVCLNNSGQTIAVMAHGLDTIYPKENSRLAESILENGGALISEYPVGTRSHKSNFVARNRIVSGLSEGVIVFEASEKSGTMHTARFAYTQGKKIFCPTLNNGVLSSGVQKLLNTGSALPIINANDIIDQLFREEKRSINMEINYQFYKALEDISKNKGIPINDLLHLAVLNFIEGENGDD